MDTGKVARDVVVLLSSSDDSDTEVEVRPVGSQRSCNSSLSCSQTSGSRPALNLVASQKSSRAIRNPSAAGVPARNKRDDPDHSSSKPPAGSAKSQSQLRNAATEAAGGSSVGEKRRGPAAGPVLKQRRLDAASAAGSNAEKSGSRLGSRQTQQPLSLSFQKVHASSIRDGASSHTRAAPTLNVGEQKEAALPPHANSLPWAQKYAPQALEDLVVHKKKLEDLRGWMETTSKNCGRPGSGCLLLTGPPGSGKTTAVQLMAAELGISISEWTPPPCTTWEEHLHNNAGADWQSGSAYRSKLDEFDDFVGRSSLFPALNLQRSSRAKANAGSAKAPDHKHTAAAGPEAGSSKEVAGLGNKKILLVDDLPHASGPEHRSRLAGVLSRLAGSSRFPTVVITTTGDRGGGSGSNSNAALGHAHGLHKDLASALETAGVHVLSFNPITVRNAAKALKAVAAKMSVNLADESATDIAEASAGDLHNALESLQLRLLGNRKIRDTPASAAANHRQPAPKPKKGKASSKALLANVSLKGTLGGGMDSGLSVFHALGKLLHNKRDSTLAGGAGRDDEDEGFVELELLAGQDLPGPAPLPPLPVSERLKRIPAKADPEKTVIRSQLSNDTVTGYLQENILDFIGDAKVEDAALCADYLSLSDVLGSRQYSRHGTDTSGTISSSVAARGTMWANSCPLSRWQPLRMPAHVVVQRATAHNQEQLASVSLGASYFKQAFTGCRAHIASQVLPYLRCLQHSPLHGPALQGVMPRQWMNVYNGKAVVQESGGGGGAVPPAEAEDEGHKPDSDGDELEGIEDC